MKFERIVLFSSSFAWKGVSIPSNGRTMRSRTNGYTDRFTIVVVNFTSPPGIAELSKVAASIHAPAHARITLVNFSFLKITQGS